MLTFDSDDLGRTEEFLSTHYAPMRIGSSGSRSRAHITRVAADAISVDRLDLAFRMRYDVTPLNKICLCDIASGTVDDHAPSGQDAQDFGPGQLFSFSPPDRPYAGEINRARYTITMLDPQVLTQLVAPARDEEGVRLLDHHTLSAAAAVPLRAAIDHLERHVLSDPVASQSALVVNAAVRYVAAQVLAAFPTTATTPPGRLDSRDARPASLHRAIAYIESHAHTDITPADISDAARVSIRTLQLAFQRHLGTTPMAYLRRVRLAAAHRDLLDADRGNGDSVAGVAARWGFFHQGRFGIAYRQAYGETPGQTLGRR